jgi:hypothetical protein
MYNSLIGEHDTPQPILDMWKTCNIPRQKFFAWLMLHNRHNTKDMMIKKNFYVEFTDCITCEECMWKVICTYFLNALSAKASGGLLAWNGILTWTCTV